MKVPRWELFHRDIRATQPWVVLAFVAFAVLLAIAGIGIVTNSGDDGVPVVVPGTPAPVTVVVTPLPASPGAPGSPGPVGSPGAPGPVGGPGATSEPPPSRPSPSPSRTPKPTPTHTNTPTPSPTCKLHDPRDGHCLL